MQLRSLPGVIRQGSQLYPPTLWAVMDVSRRPSKRQKDLADIARLLEAYPDLRQKVPAEVLDRRL